MTISQERCAELEAAYLKHILICVLSRDRNVALWRQLLDPWFAFRSGPNFVKRTESPVTFNPSEQAGYRHVMALFPFRSVKAGMTLDKTANEVITKEHAIPIAILRDALIDGKYRDDDSPIDSEVKLRSFLDANYRVGMVTQEEHDRLKQFSCQMPAGWKVGQNVYARYSATTPPVEIEVRMPHLIR